MNDYTELKPLLDACRAENCDGPREFRKAVEALFDVCTVETISALIAENESAHKHWQNESNNVQVLMAEVARLKAENDRLSRSVESLIQMERATGNRAIEYAGKCDQLKAENEALREDADRLQSATAFVQKLCDSAGKQPSVATGYLHDILAALGQGEQS